MKFFKILGLAACALALFPLSVVGQAKLVENVTIPKGEVGISYQKFELPNGLRLYVHEDHSDPIVHVEVTYHVGSARESLGKSGFAHFFEHMMFQGSENVKDEEHFKIIQGAGGQMNGTTNLDRTNYYQTIPSNYLETALWLEADRMGFLLPSFTQEKFEVQRSTVKNEKAQNIENQPYALALVEILPQNMYPQGHPYSWSTIGYVDDLDRVTYKDLENFFLRWYGPNNAILVVAGAVKTDEVVKLVEKYFGSIPRGPEVKKQKVDKVLLANDQFVRFPDNIFNPMAVKVFPTVPNFHRDEAPIDLLAQIMGGNRSSSFYKNLVESEKAVFAQVSHPCNELAGEFQIMVLSRYRTPEDTVLAIINRTLAEFDPGTITEDQIARAKASLEMQYVSSLESVQGKSSQLAEWAMKVGKPGYNVKDEMDRYNAVTKADIVRVFNKYIKGQNSQTLYVYPKNPGDDKEVKSVNPNPGATDPVKDKEYEGLKYVKAADNFDRSKQPVPGPAKPVVASDYYQAELSNGMKIIGTESSEVPIVTIYIQIKGGHLLNAYDPKTIGLASFTASMMNEGTQNYTAEQFERELDMLGASISFSASEQSTNVSLRVLKKNLKPALALLEEALLRPRFDEKDFKRMKEDAIENYFSSNRSASFKAQNAYRQAIYGSDHIMGVSSMGTDKTIGNITLQNVKDFYNRFYAPNLTNMVVVGPISKDELLAGIDFLKNWAPKNVTIPPVPPAPEIKERKIFIVDKPFAPQSEIRMGHPSIAFDYNGDFFKNQVMNFPIGGNFNSRINLNLREEKAWTYGARTNFSGSTYPGTFTFSAGIKTRATDSALDETMKELTKYVESGVTEEELNFTKNAFSQSNALNYETSYDKAGFLAQIGEYKLPKGYVDEQEKILKSLTKSDIDALAKKYIRPDQMVIVVVGDNVIIRKGIERLKLGKIEKIDPDKNTLKPFKPAN